MRKLLAKTKKKLSLLLVAAMLFGSLPQNALTASATEAEQPIETQTEVPVEEPVVEIQSEEPEIEIQEEEPIEEIQEEEPIEEIQEEEPVEEIQEEEPIEEIQEEELIEEIQSEEPEIEIQEEEPETETQDVQNEFSVIFPKEEEQIGYQIDGNSVAAYGEDYTFTVTAEDGYEVTGVVVKVDDVALEEGVTEEGVIYTVAGEQVTGKLVIEVIAEEATEPEEETINVEIVGETDGFAFIGDVTAVKGTAYTFTVTAEEGYEITEVVVKVNDVALEEGVTLGEDGLYTVVAEQVTGDLVIEVETIQKTYEVTLPEDIQYKFYDTETTALYGETYIFTVKPEEGYEIRGISYTVEGSETVVLDEQYALPTDEELYHQIDGSEITGNITIEVIAGVKTYEVAYIEGGHGYKVELSGERAERGKNYTFTVKALAGYTIDEVKYSIGEGDISEPLLPEEGIYTIPGESITDYIWIYVVTKTTPIGVAGKIQFTNAASHATYAVDEDEGGYVSKNPDWKTVYDVKEGTDLVWFTVTLPGAYEPDIDFTYYDKEKDEVATKELIHDWCEVSGKNVVYQYQIPASLLSDKVLNVVRIEETLPDVEVNLTIDESVASVKVSADGKYIEPLAVENYFTYSVPYGSTVTITPTITNEHYEFAEARTFVEGKEKFEKVKAKEFTYTVKATDTVDTEITAKGIYALYVSDESDRSLTPVKNVYILEQNHNYQIEVYRGEERLNIESYSVKLGSSVLESPLVQKLSVEDQPGEFLKVGFPGEFAGDSLKAEISVEGKKYNFTLSVRPYLKSITVKGADKNGVITQTVDTKVEYDITLNPKTANPSWLVEVDEVDKEVIEVDIVNDKLVITTKVGKANVGKEAKLTIKDTSSGIEKEITVKIGTVSLPKPTVKVIDSDAKGFTLSATNKNVKIPAAGHLYYAVTAQGVGNDSDIMYENFVPYDKENGTQIIDVDIFEKDTAIDVKFNVKVLLAYSEDEITWNEVEQKYDNADAAIIADSKNVATLKNVKVKAYYYEDKLTIKKGVTTVYRGQQNVAIGTAVFGKNTTVKTIEEERIIVSPLKYNLDGIKAEYWVNEPENSISFSVDKDSRILMSVDDNVASGTYKVEVYATAEETEGGIYNKPAVLTVDIVNQISDITLSAPVDVYKPANKAVSFTVGARMDSTAYDTNGDPQLRTKAPKTEKLSWSVHKIEDGGIGDEITDKSITVKNGKVTVSKGYILTGKDSFIVKATAADYSDNQVYEYAVVNLTNKPVEMGEVVLANYNPLSKEYRVIGRSGSTLTHRELSEAIVLVLKKGVDEKNVYSASEIVQNAAEIFTYTSSNTKIMYTYQEELDKETVTRVIAAKPGSNLKITVTSTDGSKNKAVIDKLKVAYNEYDNLELNIYPENGEYSIQDGEILFRGPKDQIIRLQLFSSVTGEDTPQKAVQAEHKVTIDGGKIITQNPVDGSYTVIATKPTIKIKLTYPTKEEKVTKEYTLKNTYDKKEKAPDVAVLGKLMELQAQDGKTSIAYQMKGSVDYNRVYVTLDQAILNTNTKDSSRYLFLNNAGREVFDKPLTIEDGKFQLLFETGLKDGIDCYLYPGSYKLNMIFGNEINDEFVPTTVTKTITLKVEKTPSIKVQTVKPTTLKTTYTLEVKEEREIQLSLADKSANIVRFYGLQDANVKGQSSQFTKYFKLDETGTKLVIKDNWNEVPSGTYTGWVSGGEYTKDGVAMYLDVTQIKVTIKNSISKIPGVSVTFNAVGDIPEEVTVYVNGEKINDLTKTISIRIENGAIAFQIKMGESIYYSLESVTVSKNGEEEEIWSDINGFYRVEEVKESEEITVTIKTRLDPP